MMRMERKLKPRLDYLLLLAGFAAFAAWYVYDTVSVSTRIENIALIVPAGLLSLAILAGLAIREIVAGGEPHDPTAISERPPWLMLGAVAGLAVGIEPLGFMPSTVAFFIVSLLILGERRPFIVVLYAIGLGVGMSLVFSQIADVPAPFWAH